MPERIPRVLASRVAAKCFEHPRETGDPKGPRPAPAGGALGGGGGLRESPLVQEGVGAQRAGLLADRGVVGRRREPAGRLIEPAPGESERQSAGSRSPSTIRVMR